MLTCVCLAAEHVFDVHEGRYGQSVPLDIVVDVAEELGIAVDTSVLSERADEIKVNKDASFILHELSQYSLLIP
jgi:hypothetical protein